MRAVCDNTKYISGVVGNGCGCHMAGAAGFVVAIGGGVIGAVHVCDGGVS